MENCKLVLKLSALTSILLLAGCGQKGPLYLEKMSDQKVTESAANPTSSFVVK